MEGGSFVEASEVSVADTGIAQAISWSIGYLLKKNELMDLFPEWHSETFPLNAFHPLRKHPPAKIRAFVDFCIEIAHSL